MPFIPKAPIEERTWFFTGELSRMTGLPIRVIEHDFDHGVLNGRRAGKRGFRYVFRVSAVEYLKKVGAQVPGLWPPDRPRRILIVEDDARIRRIVQHLLERKLGNRARIEAVAQVKDAIAAAMKETPDLVVLDYLFAGGAQQGPDAIRFLEDWAGARSVKFVVLTAFPTKARKDPAVRKHASALIAKPFAARELLDTIYTLLWRERRKNGEREPLLEVIA